MEEILKQIEVIEAMNLDTRTECFMQLQQVKKLKILLQQQVENLNIPAVTKCPLCGGETTFDEPDKCMTADCPNCIF